MFFIFVKVCRKYGFNFSLNTTGGLTLTLKSKNTFENIEIKQEYYNKNYNKLFLKAIKEMKDYRGKKGTGDLPRRC